MKRISLPIWVTIIILGGLLLSTVLAQTGVYSISASVVAGGGGSSAGSIYDLDGTIGQAAAGHIAGGVYTLDSGYWALDDTLPVDVPAPNLYLPLVERPRPPTPTPTPKPQPTLTPTQLPEIVPCNEFEPSNLRATAKPFPNIGRSCAGSFVAADDTSDWFSVNLAAGQTITVDLTGIPAKDDYDIFLYINQSLKAVKESRNFKAANEHFTYTASTTDLYYIRVFAYAKASPTHTYLLKVVVQ